MCMSAPAFKRCAGCGGFGAGLVKENGYCNHCFRCGPRERSIVPPRIFCACGRQKKAVPPPPAPAPKGKRKYADEDEDDGAAPAPSKQHVGGGEGEDEEEHMDPAALERLLAEADKADVSVMCTSMGFCDRAGGPLHPPSIPCNAGVAARCQSGFVVRVDACRAGLWAFEVAKQSDTVLPPHPPEPVCDVPLPFFCR